MPAAPSPALLGRALEPVEGRLGLLGPELRRWLARPGSALGPVVDRLTSATTGKRLRPGLVLLFADVAAARPEALTAAALVELVHAGSLYHDDVIDGAVQRRGVPSANAEFGVPMAITGGDYLLARSSAAAASLGTDVATWAAETVTELCRGEAEETAVGWCNDRSEEHYRAAVEGKTGSLMALACRLGAWCRGASASESERAARAGLELGVAYQVVDDLLDLCGPVEELGRPPGTDLAQGVTTLPVILGLCEDPRLLAGLPGEPVAAARAVASRLAGTGALDATLAELDRTLARSRAAARGIPGEDAVEALGRWLLARADVACRAVGPSC